MHARTGLVMWQRDGRLQRAQDCASDRGGRGWRRRFRVGIRRLVGRSCRRAWLGAVPAYLLSCCPDLSGIRALSAPLADRCDPGMAAAQWQLVRRISGAAARVLAAALHDRRYPADRRPDGHQGAVSLATDRGGSLSYAGLFEHGGGETSGQPRVCRWPSAAGKLAAVAPDQFSRLRCGGPHPISCKGELPWLTITTAPASTIRS